VESVIDTAPSDRDGRKDKAHF